MKNITLSKPGEAVTIHTPHGSVTVYNLGGPTTGEGKDKTGWTHNEVKVAVDPRKDEHHFVQIGSNPDPASAADFPFVLRLRDKSHVTMKELHDESSPLYRMTQAYLKEHAK